MYGKSNRNLALTELVFYLAGKVLLVVQLFKRYQTLYAKAIAVLLGHKGIFRRGKLHTCTLAMRNIANLTFKGIATFSTGFVFVFSHLYKH